MKKILFIICLILIPSVCWPATYYVKTGGNDSSAGTSDGTAWAHSPGMSGCTGTCASTTLQTNDTVYLRSQDTWSSSAGTSLVLTAVAGVTYDGATYGAGTRATLRAADQRASNQSNHGVLEIDASNVTVTGINVDGNQEFTCGIVIGYNATSNISNITINNVVEHDNLTPNTGFTQYGYGLLVTGSNDPGITVSNVTIQNSTFYNTGGEAIAIYQSWGHPGNVTDGVLIRNNLIHDTGLCDTNSLMGAGIAIVNDSRNVTVEFNTMYNNYYSIWIRSSYEVTNVSGAPTNMIIRYNLVYNSYHFGIHMSNPAGSQTGTHSGQDCISSDTNCAPTTMSGSIYGNILYNTGTHCGGGYNEAWIIYVGEYHWNASNINFYNNTLYDSEANVCTNGAGILGVAKYGASGWLLTGTINFKNNIAYSSNDGAYWSNYSNILDESGGGITYSNNLVYRTTGATAHHVYYNSTFYDRNGGATDLVLHWDATAQKTDPTFTGGSLPTGFSGTYGSNMVPNTTYFAITNGNAIGNGATVGYPYNGSINQAGLQSPLLRPIGAYDIGAYQYTSTGNTYLPWYH